MNDIIEIEGRDVTELYKDAVSTHTRIMANGEIAGRALAEVCKDLKRMRDEKLYEQLGYDTFDRYCENMAGIKSRMAYNYISTYERLGTSVLQSNANLGITKLELIAGMNAVERAEGLASGEFEGMSVAEIKELVRKNKEQGEQIDLLQQQLEETTAVSEDNARSDGESKYDAEKDELYSKVAELEKMLGKQKEEYEDKLDDLRDEIEDEIRAEVEKEYEGKTTEPDHSEEIDKAILKAVAEAKKETEKEVKAKLKEKSDKQKAEIEDLKAAIASADSDKEKLQKQLALSDTKSAKAMVYVQAIQDNFNSLFALISEMDEEQQNRFKGAVIKLTNAMQEKAGVINEN